MQAQVHPLEFVFHEAVRNSFEGALGDYDPEMTGYLTQLLCEFSDVTKLYKLKDDSGRPLEELGAMLRAADPVHGAANSFDEERAVRKHIGDYALFVAGLCPEAIDPHRTQQSLVHPTLGELIKVGKESYFIVSQFNLFEYELEAPLFARLSERFEHCVLGLTLVQQKLHEYHASA